MIRVFSESTESFWRGCREHSWASIMIALTICVATLWGGSEFLTESFFVSRANLFAKAEDPRPVQTARDLLAVADLAPSVALITLIGDRSLLGGEGIAPLIANRSFSFDLLDLRYRDQTVWESVGLADRLPVGARGLAVIDASAMRLSASLQQLRQVARSPRMPLRSRAFDRELLQAGLTCQSLSGNYFWDNQAFFVRSAPTVVWNLLGQPTIDHARLEESPIERRPLEIEPEPRVDVLDRLVGSVLRRTDLSVLLVYSRTPEVTREWSDRCKAGLESLVRSPRVRLVDRADPMRLWDSVRELVQTMQELNSGEGKP